MTTALALATQIEAALAEYRKIVKTVKVQTNGVDTTEEFQADVLAAVLESFSTELGREKVSS